MGHTTQKYTVVWEKFGVKKAKTLSEARYDKN